MADVKELSIGNNIYDIKAKSVVDTNSGSVKMWTGTKAQYDAISSYGTTTLYNIEGVGLYKGTTLIAGSLPNSANQDLSNLSQTGQAVIDGKADTDLSNVPTAKGILIESYNNSNSWYRVYADGWCEQGGVIGSEGTTRGKTQSISFAKPFRDSLYTIIAVNGNTSYTTYSGSVAIATILNSTKSETGVSVGLYGFAQTDTHGVVNWVAYGYIS